MSGQYHKNGNDYHFHNSPHYAQPMLAIARFTVPLADAAHFEGQLTVALDAFSACTGFVSGEFGQNLDDPTLWSLVTHWENVGSYRRALSNNDVKMNAIPILAQAIDEPGAYGSVL
jgi:hypothetical protein